MDNAVKLASVIVSLMNKDGEFDLGNYGKYIRFLYALSSVVSVPYPHNDSFKRRVIASALKRLIGLPIEKEQLLSTIADEAAQLSSRERLPYQVLFGINVKNGGDELLTESFAVNYDKVSYRFIDYHAALDEYHIDKIKCILPANDKYEKACSQYRYCIITRYAANPNDALNDASTIIEAARARANYALKTFVHTWAWPSRPLSEISPSYVVRCYNEANELQLDGYTIGDYDYGIKRLNETTVSKALDWLRYLRERPKGILKERIISAISLYGEALDQRSYSYRFLHLWQALEILLDTGEERKIQSIVKGLLRDDDSICEIIGPLLHQRNRLIHKGRIQDFAEDDTFILRDLIDVLIANMLNIGGHLGTAAEVRDLWDIIDLSPSELNRKKKVLDIASKLHTSD